MKEEIEKTKSAIEHDIVQIGCYFKEVLGFPIESFVLQLEQTKTLADQLSFCLSFYENHKKWGKDRLRTPFLYKNQ